MKTVQAADACVGRLQVDDRALSVWLTIRADDVEHVGRLGFRDDAYGDELVMDRGVFPGPTAEAVIARAQGLTEDELVQRYRRAVSEQRRHPRLRDVTHEVLSRIRSLNRVSISMQAGLVDTATASREIAVIEGQLHALVGRLRDAAGIVADDDQTRD